MVSQSRKHRGYATQRIVADAWREDGWPYAQPVGAGAQGADLTGTPGIGVEIKARTGFEPLAALRQATANARGGVPVVILRPNGCGETTIDEWPMILPHAVGRRLLRQAGYGTPPACTCDCPAHGRRAA